MNSIKNQLREKKWIDETGQEIPANRILPIEKMKEKTSYNLAKEALSINAKLIAFKESITADCQKIYDEVMKDGQKGKGNFTFFNFDGSIKVEVQVNELITFDSMQIELAKQKLMELVGESITSDKVFIKELVLSAFQTSKGQLDTKKVLGLKKHAKRITDERYHEAMDLIDSAIRRPESKTYFRIWVRNTSGQFENVDLNFSSIS